MNICLNWRICEYMLKLVDTFKLITHLEEDSGSLVEYTT